MQEQNDRRQFIRMDVDQALTYKFQNSLRRYPGICKNLSSSGVLFVVCRNNIKPGDILEVQINTDSTAVSSVTMLVEIIRTKLVGEQLVEVASQIKGIRT